MSDSNRTSGGQSGSGSKEVFEQLLRGEELTLLKNRSLFNEFLNGFKESTNPYNEKSSNRGERFLSYRYRLYHNLAMDEEMIARAQLAVIVSEVSILSLEAFTRASFDFSEFYKKTPPDTLSAEDLQAVLEGDAARTTAALNNHFSLPDDSDYQLRLQGKLAITNLAARFGFLVATTMAAGTGGSRTLHDHIFSSCFSVADDLIMKSASLFGPYVYEDDFRKALLEEASQFAKDMPSYLLSEDIGFEERAGRIRQRFQQMRQDNFIERVKKNRSRGTSEDKLKGADEGDDKKRAIEEERIVIRDVERDVEVEIPDLSASLKGNQEAIDAGKAIMDYLRNLKLGGLEEEQEIEVESGASASSDDEEEEELQEELDSAVEYDVYIDSNKRRMKKSELQAAASHGLQVAFLSAKQMQKFNQSTNHAYAKNVSLYNTSRKEGKEVEAPQASTQQQSQSAQQTRQRSRQKKTGWFGLGFGRSRNREDEDEHDKSKEKSQDKKDKGSFGRASDNSQKKGPPGRSSRSERQSRREERKAQRFDARDRKYMQFRKQVEEMELEFDEKEEKMSKELKEKKQQQKSRNLGNEQKRKMSGILKDYLHDMKDTQEIQGHESNTAKAERDKHKNPEIKR